MFVATRRLSIIGVLLLVSHLECRCRPGHRSLAAVAHELGADIGTCPCLSSVHHSRARRRRRPGHHADMRLPAYATHQEALICSSGSRRPRRVHSFACMLATNPVDSPAVQRGVKSGISEA